MADGGNRQTVERYVKAMYSDARGADLAEYYHPDFIEDWPQSGERIRGQANHIAVRANYPDPGAMPGELDRIIGGEDRWVTTPSFTLLKIEGTGDVYTVTGYSIYPNGDPYHVVQILKLRQGKVAHVTTYFAAPFESAEWRKEWVEAIPKE